MKTRRALDAYSTAPWQVDALVDHLPELAAGGSVWYPCVGDGAIDRRLRDRVPQLWPIITNDLNPEVSAHFHGDASKPEVWQQMAAEHGRPDWIIDNPPFNVEIDIVMQAWEVAVKGVILMSRVSFAEPTSATKYHGKPITPRGPWLAAHPYAKRITLERYSFTGDGQSDSATTDWLVWSRIPIAPPFGVSAFGYKAKA